MPVLEKVRFHDLRVSKARKRQNSNKVVEEKKQYTEEE